MDLNIIRGIIFFIAGLVMIFFPEKILSVQVKLLKKLGMRYRRDRKILIIFGIIFLIISVVLFFVGFF